MNTNFRSEYRPYCARDIQSIIQSNPKATVLELRKLCRQTRSYREMKTYSHTYKIWCSEFNNQTAAIAARENQANPDTFELKEGKTK